MMHHYITRPRVLSPNQGILIEGRPAPSPQLLPGSGTSWAFLVDLSWVAGPGRAGHQLASSLSFE